MATRPLPLSTHWVLFSTVLLLFCQATFDRGIKIRVPTTPACTWWNRPEEDPSSGKLESTHPSRTSVKYDQVFFCVESIMRVNAASLDIRDATTTTPGTLNDLTTDLILANNNKSLPYTGTTNLMYSFKCSREKVQ